ncbi:MAG: glycine cleavage system protein GcvH [Chloroflexi bacterium]|nr:glycine cleavage system protein GcvH [Chloroflexota bacterium]
MHPKDYKYTKGHTWVRVEGEVGLIGITDFAQKELGSVLFVELASVGDAVVQSKPCGSVESDKATSDVMCPVSGQVLEVNEEAMNAPETVNKDPHGAGWLLKVRLANKTELNSLMSAAEFERYIAK